MNTSNNNVVKFPPKNIHTKTVLSGEEIILRVSSPITSPIAITDNRMSWAIRYRQHTGHNSLPVLTNNWYAAHLANHKRNKHIGVA